MSSEATSTSFPRTAVQAGITDPVEAARAELKAALSAIEEKVNVQKQARRAAVKAKLFARRKPIAAAAAAAGVAAAVGGLVWLVVRSKTGARG